VKVFKIFWIFNSSNHCFKKLALVFFVPMKNVFLSVLGSAMDLLTQTFPALLFDPQLDIIALN
jgi:hypothetical protein